MSRLLVLCAARSRRSAPITAFSALTAYIVFDDDAQNDKLPNRAKRNAHGVVKCEKISSDSPESTSTAAHPSKKPNPSSSPPFSPVSGWRQRLSSILPSSISQRLVLPLPRIPVKHDPALMLPSHVRRQRERDAIRVQELQVETQRVIASQTSHMQQELAQLVTKIYETLYGPGTTPQGRQDFLQRYGCAGYTDEILTTIWELAGQRGVIEVGAGNGQWARVVGQGTSVLAYDDFSHLPLDPRVYHRHSQAHRDYFGTVEQGDASMTYLTQWKTRGRVLLLVFPPPGAMAHQALSIYQSSPENRILLYVGEGRGGANADDDFFDLLESGDWVLTRMVPVLRYGTKGYEKLFVFERRNMDV